MKRQIKYKMAKNPLKKNHIFQDQQQDVTSSLKQGSQLLKIELKNKN